MEHLGDLGYCCCDDGGAELLLDLLKFITVTAPVYALFSNASLIFKIKNKKGSISGDFENVKDYRN